MKLKHKQYKSINGILISDYAKGMITSQSMEMIKKFASKYDIPIVVDPNREYELKEYTGVTLIKPNEDEANQLIDCRGRTQEQIARKIKKEYECDVVLTWGAKGMYVPKGNQVIRIFAPNLQGKQLHTVGAGDTVAAVLAVAISQGISVEEAARLANVAAGVSITTKGLGRPSQQDIVRYYYKAQGSI